MHAWCDNFFKLWVGCRGEYMYKNDATKSRSCMDVALMFVCINGQMSLDGSFFVGINESLFTFNIVEKLAEDRLCNYNEVCD